MKTFKSVRVVEGFRNKTTSKPDVNPEQSKPSSNLERKMQDFKPFGKIDYMNYAGVENLPNGGKPLISRGPLEDGLEYSIVISGDDGDYFVELEVETTGDDDYYDIVYSIYNTELELDDALDLAREYFDDIPPAEELLAKRKRGAKRP